MELKGRVYKFGDNVSTDLIISGRYKFAITDMKELGKHIMEDARPGFYDELEPGGAFIVAGYNWGMGSSREQAPLALKSAGISAVIAKSFARIFYRNSFNIGLPLIECDTSGIDERDELEIDLDKGLIKNLSKKTELTMRPLPRVMRKLLQDGGVIGHFKKHGGLNFDS